MIVYANLYVYLNTIQKKKELLLLLYVSNIIIIYFILYNTSHK